MPVPHVICWCLIVSVGKGPLGPTGSGTCNAVYEEGGTVIMDISWSHLLPAFAALYL